MTRYDVPGGEEALYEPGSDGAVFRNLLGIADRREMDQLEFEALVRVQVDYVDRIGPDTQFTGELLRQMHRDWLGGIYDWAGEYRRVNVAKGEFRWPPWSRVEENMQFLEDSVFEDLTPCEPGTVIDVAAELAEVHGDLLLVHPFLEGNGRLARWLADLMALQAEFPRPVYGFTDEGGEQRERYLVAVTRAYGSDYEPLRDFFVGALERGVAESS